MSTKWQDLAIDSHYKTAVAVKDSLVEGDLADARAGIEELIEALTRAEKRAVRAQLIRLMQHIIKWRSQPSHRSRSWAATIFNAREEIADHRDEVPRLTRSLIEGFWEKCFESARRFAEAEMDGPATVDALTWEQVFDEEYELPEPPRRRKREKE